MPCTQAFLDANIAPDVDKAAQGLINVPITFAGNPTNNVVPAFQHQFCHDTVAGDLYWASTALAAGWKKLNN